MARVDYLSDEDGDILISNGDLVKGDSDFEHIRFIIESNAGDFREHPELGFGVRRFKNAKSTLKERFVSELREQLQSDGFKVNKIDVSKPDWWKKFELDAE